MRSLNTIAKEIKSDWAKINYGAVPYLQAMQSLSSIDDTYYYDSGRTIVLYFLSNASAWRGDKAKEIKSELKAMLK
jgi:hypothetical protein